VRYGGADQKSAPAHEVPMRCADALIHRPPMDIGGFLSAAPCRPLCKDAGPPGELVFHVRDELLTRRVPDAHPHGSQKSRTERKKARTQPENHGHGTAVHSQAAAFASSFSHLHATRPPLRHCDIRELTHPLPPTPPPA